MCDDDEEKWRQRIQMSVILLAVSIVSAIISYLSNPPPPEPIHEMDEAERRAFIERTKKAREEGHYFSLGPRGNRVNINDRLYPPCEDTEIKTIPFSGTVTGFEKAVDFVDWGSGSPESTDQVLVKLISPEAFSGQYVFLQLPSSADDNWNRPGESFDAEIEQNRYALFCGFAQCLSMGRCTLGAPKHPVWRADSGDTGNGE